MLLRLDIQKALCQQVVQVADQRRELARLHPLPEQVAGKVADILRHLLQRHHVGGGTDGRAHLLER